MNPITKNMLVAALYAATFTTIPTSLAGDKDSFTPKDIKWTTGPDSLPKGAEVVLLEGNPGEVGAFTLRLKFPAHYHISPHYHPATERCHNVA